MFRALLAHPQEALSLNKVQVKCASSWLFLLRNYVTMMHGQQNIKIKNLRRKFCVFLTVHLDICIQLNQLYALFILSLFSHFALHVSGLLVVHHQEVTMYI
jgi:hypothetical protein